MLTQIDRPERLEKRISKLINNENFIFSCNAFGMNIEETAREEILREEILKLNKGTTEKRTRKHGRQTIVKRKS